MLNTGRKMLLRQQIKYVSVKQKTSELSILYIKLLYYNYRNG